MKIRKLIESFLCITIFLHLIIQPAAAQDGLGWYCVRNKDHKQPRADANMQFIEKYNGYYIDHRHGDECEEKVVYLTFDAGYENGNVEKILDTLGKEQVPGAFFVLENLITRNTDLVCRMIKEGHTVANHTASHKDMTKLGRDEFAAELKRLEDIFQEKTGSVMPKYYRPPEGKFNETSMKLADELGYKTIFWSFAYADWDNNQQMSRERAIAKILDNMHNGAVILLHPTSATNAAILGDVIQALKAQGYRFGTLDELTGQSVQS